MAGTEALEIPQAITEDLSEAAVTNGLEGAETEQGVQREEPQDEADFASRAPTKVGRRKMAATAVSIRDGEFLRRFVSTLGCRRAVWNEYFENARKGACSHPGFFPFHS